MSLYFDGEVQSLKEILEARDIRVEYQKYLISKYKSTVVSYKLNMPGAIKYSSLIKKIFDEGILAFKQKLEEASISIVYDKAWYKNSGPEYFAVFELDAYTIKKLTTAIEETHALGRLYDFDVINTKGEQISRQKLGLNQRKCLLCNAVAFECSRSRKHEVDTLISHIETIALDYFKEVIK